MIQSFNELLWVPYKRFCFSRLGGERGTGVPEYGVRGTGYGVRDPGVWKTRGVENTGSGGKHGVWWKIRGLSGIHGV